MARIPCVLLLLALGGCIPNMNREPERWVTVLNADTKEPIPDIHLHYSAVRKPYLIASSVHFSRPYITDKNGRAHVPERVFLKPMGGNWIRVDHMIVGRSFQESIKSDVILLMPLERYYEKHEKGEIPFTEDAFKDSAAD